MNDSTDGVPAGLDGARVLVTGGCGLIGSRIGRLLRRAGAVVVALDTLGAYRFDYAAAFGARHSYDEIVHGDVADPLAVAQAMRGCDYVVHAAAFADVAACTSDAHESTRSNIVGTQAVLDEAARVLPRRFVFVSSASVYGNGAQPGHAQQWAESTPAAPVSVYGNAKLWGEWQTRAQLDGSPVEHVSLRYFSVYGEPQVPKPGSHSWCMAWFGFRAAAGLPLRLNHGGRQIRDFVHVDEVAEATVRALVAPGASGLVLNVGTGRPTSVAEVAALVAGRFPGVHTTNVPGRSDDPMGGYADITLMQRCLGWRPRITVADGVDRYLAWLRTSPLLAALSPALLAAELRASEARGSAAPATAAAVTSP